MSKIINFMKVNPFSYGIFSMFLLGVLIYGWSFLALSNVIVTAFVFIGIAFYFTRDLIHSIINIRWSGVTKKDLSILILILFLLLVIKYN